MRPARCRAMHYDRTIIAYHGCDATIARRLLKGEPFEPSDNDYDWLGRGIYFWEFGPRRALQFAAEQRRRKKVSRPAVVGALLQLGRCFDLMDTRFTSDLGAAHETWAHTLRKQGLSLPVNGGATSDKLLRRLDCAVINWYLDLATGAGAGWDTVRCGFTEGPPVYPGAGIHQQSHVQIAVRNPGCIIGVFNPRLEPS